MPITERRKTLDDFKRTDGFHPARMSTIETPAQAAPTMPLPTGQQPYLGKQPAHLPDGTIDLSLEDENKPKHRKKRFHFRRPTRKTMIISGAVLIVGIGVFAGNAWYRLNQVFKGGGASSILQDGVDPNRLNGEGDGRVNILLLGKGGDGHTAPDLTDTILSCQH